MTLVTYPNLYFIIKFAVHIKFSLYIHMRFIYDYDLKTVRYTNGKFLVFGSSKNSGILLTSINGINWFVSKIVTASK